MQLVKYEAACKAVAEAKTVDEIKEIQNRAEAIRAYARQAKNRQLELDAMEIRVRAERKGGALLVEMQNSKVLRKQGVRDHTASGQRLLRLSDLGIDGDESGLYKRLAKIPDARFEHEVREWRGKSETSSRVEMPLQVYRKPSIRATRQKAAHFLGRRSVDPADRFGKYRTSDGRRVADWRYGELQRIQNEALRTVHLIDALFEQMPVANPDPLETIEMIFDVDALEKLIRPIWDAPVGQVDTGIDSERIAAARAARAAKYRRKCTNCGTEFIMRRPSGKARAGVSNEGQFCCRSCAHQHRKRCGT